MAFTPKPLKGTAYLERKNRRATLNAYEKREMQAAVQRDGRKCRWPNCSGKFRGLPLALDACHVWKHRGNGGDWTGLRTQQRLIMCMCRRHHGMLDSHLLRIDAMTDRGTDGPLAYYEKHPETGEFQHIFTEPSR